MAEGEASIPTEDDADECLHCAIVNMVEERIAAGGADAANLAALIAESLVDVVLRVPEGSRRNSWRAPWRLWATCFCRKAGRRTAAPDQRISALRSPRRYRHPRRTLRLYRPGYSSSLSSNLANLERLVRGAGYPPFDLSISHDLASGV